MPEPRAFTAEWFLERVPTEAPLRERVAAGNAHGQPTLAVSMQQESYAFGIDSLVFTVTRTATTEGETNDPVTLVQEESFPNPGVLRWNITLAAHDGNTDTEESSRTGSERERP